VSYGINQLAFNFLVLQTQKFNLLLKFVLCRKREVTVTSQTIKYVVFYDRPLPGSVVGSFSCPGLEDMSGFVPPLFGKPLSPRRNPRVVWRMSSVHSWNTWIRISGKSRLFPGEPVLYPLPWPGTRSWSHVFAILRLGQSSLDHQNMPQNLPGIKKVNFSENKHKCRIMFCNQKNHKTSKSP